MKSRQFQMYFFLITIFLFRPSLQSQENIITYNLKKGEVLDLIFLSQNSGSGDALKNYFASAFPIAKEYSYQSLPGLKIVNQLDGNLRAESLIFGKWENIQKRKAFLETIISRIPDFHEQRRNIWSFFGLTYYEMLEDKMIQIDKERYNVTTAIWTQDLKSTDKLQKKWHNTVRKYGGDIVFELTDGTSPYGYYYNPDLLLITSWKSQSDFEKFQKECQADKERIQHINQFAHTR